MPVLLILLLTILPVWSQDWHSFAGARLVPTDFADGDSFVVTFQDAEGKPRQEVVRLYFVDCVETAATNDSDRRRVLEQARYFGAENPAAVLAYGEEAARTVGSLLQEPFTLKTVFATAPGRSGKPRIYGMVELADGRDLAAVLVESGLARVKGVSRQLPDGTRGADYEARLQDLEMAAAMRQKGIWKISNPDKIASLRQQEREETAALRSLLSDTPTSPPEKVSVNAASVEDLTTVPGIGQATARRIVEFRPYQSLEELERVPGLGTKRIALLAPYLRL